MVRFDRIIPPGGEGNIALKIDTRNSSGPIQKSVRVLTNDLKNTDFILTVKAFVKVPINISPRQVDMRGYEGQSITGSVIITAMEKMALNLEPVYFDLSEDISYRIETLEAGVKYRIIFKSPAVSVGIFKGLLRLKTNYSDKPEIHIPVSLQIRKKDVTQNK